MAAPGPWSDKIFRYCERGGDPAFWAEPFNALSNAAFIAAAAAAALHLARRREAGAAVAEAALVALVFAIGIGSFLFHTLATRWASVADTAPIGLFMLAYFGYALKRFLGCGWVVSLVGVAGFVVALRLAADIPCVPGLLPVTRAGGHPCFNGSLGYLPALVALIGIGGWLVAAGHRAGGMVLAAGVVFAVSLTLRTVDFEICALTQALGRPRGTHALWHLCNALTLYLLLVAAIAHGAPRASPARP
jgi:hypothetical protein